MSEIKQVIGGSIQTNSYILLNDKSIIAFDFVPELEHIIEKNNYKLEKILLTHSHFDHFEGLADFQKKYDFELYLSEKTCAFFKNPNPDILALLPQPMIKNLQEVDLSNVKILKDKDVVTWYDNTIEIFESPGHSPGSIMYIMKNLKTVITGDTIFYQSIGRTDLPGGDYNLIIDSIKRLFDTIDEDCALYPGHGPVTSVSFEKTNNFFLRDLNL